MTAARSTWAKLAAAGLVPVAASAAWVPLRDRLPNTDLALALVLVIGVAGWLGGASASLLAAAAAAVSFDVLGTRPYGTLAISRGTDVTTALALLVTGVLVGVGAARLARYHRTAYGRTDALAVVMEASGLVATGEERRLITAALGAELQRSLELSGCEFRPEPPGGRRPSVARNGGLVGLVPAPQGDAPGLIDLPVWSQGEVVAHYRLTVGKKTPTRDELRVALSLADQAGAALAGGGPSPPPHGRLRLLNPARR